MHLVARGLAALGGFLPIAALWLSFCLVTFGTLVPTTFVSKASTFSLTNVATLRSIVLVLGSSLAIPAVLALLARVVGSKPLSLDGARFRRLHLPVWFALLTATFYFVSVPNFQGPGRYLLPAVYALVVGTTGAAILWLDGWARQSAARAIATGMAVAHLVGMLTVHQATVVPVLAGFRDNYWKASIQAADYLAEAANPGETVLALSDVGMLAYYSRDRYRVFDVPGLTDSALVGLSIPQIVRRTGARIVVEHYGSDTTTVLDLGEGLVFHRVRSYSFAAAGLVSTRDRFSLNIYRAATDQGRR